MISTMRYFAGAVGNTKSHLKKVFRCYDPDMSGYVHKEAFGKALVELGISEISEIEFDVICAFFVRGAQRKGIKYAEFIYALGHTKVFIQRVNVEEVAVAIELA